MKAVRGQKHPSEVGGQKLLEGVDLFKKESFF
jgi:hypothetical protein